MRKLMGLLGVAGAVVAAGCGGAAETGRAEVEVTGDPHLDRAYRVLAHTPLIDGHNDLPWVIRRYEAAPMDVAAYDLRRRTPGHTDIERLRAGRVGAQFWAAYVSCDYVAEGGARVMLEQIDIIRRMTEEYSDVFELALTAADIERIFA